AGFATVNAMSVTLGLGECTQLEELVVKFPGGEQRMFKNVAADTFYLVVEGKGIKAIPGIYDRARAMPSRAASSGTSSELASLAASAPGHARYVLVDLFATWCQACIRNAPRLDALVASTSGRLDAVTITVEPTDDAAALAKFHATHPELPVALAYDSAL